jgi:hypothetical protein
MEMAERAAVVDVRYNRDGTKSGIGVRMKSVEST